MPASRNTWEVFIKCLHMPGISNGVGVLRITRLNRPQKQPTIFPDGDICCGRITERGFYASVQTNQGLSIAKVVRIVLGKPFWKLLQLSRSRRARGPGAQGPFFHRGELLIVLSKILDCWHTYRQDKKTTNKHLVETRPSQFN